MAQYIDREALVNWLKHIPLKDLSDGHGLCRVIMEDDFKTAISSLPESTFVDMGAVVHCKDCVYSRQLTGLEKNVFIETVVMCTNSDMHDYAWPMYETDYCSYGKANEVPNGSDAD